MSAVNLVATRGAPAATVAGLRLAEAAMAIVRPRASERGVVLEMLWGPDEHACDVRVQPGNRPTDGANAPEVLLVEDDEPLAGTAVGPPGGAPTTG